MKKWIIATVALLVIATVAFAAAGRGRRVHGEMGGMGWLHGMGLARLEARLKLTPEQSTQIRQIAHTEKQRMFQRWGSGADNRNALMKEIFRDNPNQAEITRRVQTLLQEHTQMLNQLVAAGLEVNKVLTPEQRAELQQVVDENAQAAQRMRERALQRRQERQQAAPQQ